MKLCLKNSDNNKVSIALQIFDRWTEFNGISTHLELYYAQTLGNHVYDGFIFSFLVAIS